MLELKNSGVLNVGVGFKQSLLHRSVEQDLIVES